MKTSAVSMAALLALTGVASAQVTYNDAAMDLFDNGFAHLDILSVTVSHDATDLYFTITTRGDVSNPNWGKFCVGIDGPGGVNDAGNGWGRPINWNGQGIDFWVGTWADNNGGGFGGELRGMDGSGGNVLIDATYTTGTLINGTSTVTQNIRVSRAPMGLLDGMTFYFDVLSSGGGGGDPGVDHLSRNDPATPDWSVPSVAGAFLPYTIPTPGALALLGLGGLLVARRRR
ncbi:hypothetical protein PHYC_03541 [Phycisphaerales bacterium]|nr:hypothetical protein PHYC_03541 [Phycisphaerales bacterium]